MLIFAAIDVAATMIRQPCRLIVMFFAATLSFIGAARYA